jgi:hypothetical protein
LHLIPANIYSLLRFLYSVTVAPALKEKRQYLKDNGILRPSDIMNIYKRDVPWITQSIPETDFPISVLPPNVIPVGPIYISTELAADRDPELAAWLKKAPTVLINLGSSVTYDQTMGTEMARAIKEIIDTSDVQVLWKFNKHRGGAGSRWNELETGEFKKLQEEIKKGRLRMPKWISIDPAALLETGDVVLSVHHGGANCYNEAVGYDIPLACVEELH